MLIMDVFVKFIPREFYVDFVINDKKFILPPNKTVDFKSKPISIFNDYVPTFDELNLNPYNILVIQEPNEYFGLHDFAIQNQNAFTCILTWSEQILKHCEQSILFPFGTSFLWDDPEYVKSEIPKRFNTSFLCGAKRMTNGHMLRHKIFEAQSRINMQNLWIYSCPCPEKRQCWNSMFHVAVENTKQTNYFTEKIIDPFLTKTIPIYWGCPNIGNFFNKDGFITFNDEEELIKIINNLTEKDYYDRIPAINENYKKALYYGDFFYRMNELLQEIVIINKI
jgi:Glycosyltransferase family 10 (fucosyltransferase) C-term